MTAATSVEDRVRTALHDRAATLVVPDVAFDPSAPRRHDEPRPPGRRVARALAVAAVLVLVAGSAALVLRAGDAADDVDQLERSGPAPTTETPTTTAPIAPDDVAGWLPNEVPEGLLVWDISWGTTQVGGPAGWSTVQLFGSPNGDGPRVRISFQPSVGSIPGGADVPVRGTTGGALPSKDHPDVSSALTWVEGNVLATADYTGMSEADVVAFLDTLTWRSDDHLAGFAPPPGGGDLALLDEAQQDPASTTVATSTVGYREGPAPVGPDEPQLIVTTTWGAAQPAFDRVAALYLGRIDEEGRLVEYDASFDHLTVVWPDGRRTTLKGGGIGEAGLLAIAEGLVPATEPDLVAARDEVAARVGQAVDATAEATFTVEGLSAPVTVRLREDDGARLACVQVGEAPEQCSAESIESVAVASVLVDGTWVVALAGPETAQVTSESLGEGEDLAPQEAQDGDHHLAVLVPPAGLDEIHLTVGNQGRNVLRPTG